MTTKPKMSARNAVIDVLEKAGEPMKAKDVIARVLADYETGLKGKTPDATVSAQLYLAAKAGRIVKADRGMFRPLTADEKAALEPAAAPVDAEATPDAPEPAAETAPAQPSGKRTTSPDPMKPAGKRAGRSTPKAKEAAAA